MTVFFKSKHTGNKTRINLDQIESYRPNLLCDGRGEIIFFTSQGRKIVWDYPSHVLDIFEDEVLYLDSLCKGDSKSVSDLPIHWPTHWPSGPVLDLGGIQTAINED